MQRFALYLIGGQDDETAEFIARDDETACYLACSFREARIEASADDYFEALCIIRSRLEEDGLIPFCYGASLNVYPSAMSRQMSGGTSAYRLTLGKQALNEDLVPIFAEGSDVIPSTLSNQREFFEKWLQSLG